MINHINLEVTNRCNQRCIYCFNDSGPSPKSISKSFDHWIQVIDKLITFGLKSIHLTGGEPFIFPKLEELILHCLNSKLSVSVLTNGARVERAINKNPCLYRNLNSAQVSLDTLDPVLLCKRRGSPRALVDAMSAIKSLRSVGVRVEVSAVIDDSNVHTASELTEFCQSNQLFLILRISQKHGRNQKSSPGWVVNEISRLSEEYAETIIPDQFCYLPDERERGVSGAAFTIESMGIISPPLSLNGSFFSCTNKLLKAA